MKVIYADALKQALQAHYETVEQDFSVSDSFRAGVIVGLEVAAFEIDDAKPIDSKPEVHAYWWWEDLDEYWVCSHCNNGESSEKRKYCPDCGARMDEPACGPEYCEIGGDEGA